MWQVPNPKVVRSPNLWMTVVLKCATFLWHNTYFTLKYQKKRTRGKTKCGEVNRKCDLDLIKQTGSSEHLTNWGHWFDWWCAGCVWSKQKIHAHTNWDASHSYVWKQLTHWVTPTYFGFIIHNSCKCHAPVSLSNGGTSFDNYTNILLVWNREWFICKWYNKINICICVCIYKYI